VNAADFCKYIGFYLMPTIKLIIFDLDGTLTDSLADLTDAVNYVRAHYKKAPLSQEQVRTMVGQGARVLVQRALEDQPSSEIDRALPAFLAYNERHLADKTILYPGVSVTLSSLQQHGYLLAVISNKNEDLCRKLLSILGVESCFSLVLGGDSLPERKPSPLPLLTAMERLHVAPSETVMVGDSINDIAAGAAAGVKTIGCRYGYGDHVELKDADMCISNLGELLQIQTLL
jgi:phosphoglycolate phosphatase